MVLLRIKEMISSTIKERKKLIEKGIEKFDDKYLSEFDSKLSDYISEAEKTANYYALIRSYIETCRRNGINEYDALVRLCDDNPYTVDEIFSQSR